MTELPLFIHTAAQIQALERDAIEKQGCPSYTLMTRAGEAGLRELRRAWPQARHIVVVCGGGNNAGDGYVLARLAMRVGMRVTVIALFDPSTLRGDALRAEQQFTASGGVVSEWSEAAVKAADVLVDAIFGTGLARPLDDRVASCVVVMNAAAAPIFSLDVPSGLHADTGEVLGAAINADRTMTFVGLKLGFYVGVGPDHVGSIQFDDLGVSNSGERIVAQRMLPQSLATLLPARPRTSHKGMNGRVLIVGGGRGMAGAARLAGEAALRAGAGLVTVATCAENVAAIVTNRPELIVRAVENAAELQRLMAQADVIAIGPGLGQDEWSRAMYKAALDSDRLLIMDADALNLLAAAPLKRDNWILTPHPGEAARLLRRSTAHVQADRLTAVNSMAHQYGGTIVLKGASTLVTRENTVPFVCDYGNAGMATAGMGDVLTGVIAGLAAQLDDPFVAARTGVLVHALAGDAAAAKGKRGLIASDLFEHLRGIVNPHA
ncbi:MAG: NAD(P)H-hydrate dehydratase [Candidatus Obscuribacterales bacterium]|nr:NAD(P)H-hydrate dehydratase [Steroidobacteraceae bacterium]